MKTLLVRPLFVLVFLSLNRFAFAGDFVSQVVQGSDPVATFTITVPGDRFLVIRNFTQEGPAEAVTTRGFVSATDRTGLAATMLIATIVDPDNTTSLEPINNIVIAGPSTVTVTGGNTSCFITYRKGDD